MRALGTELTFDSVLGFAREERRSFRKGITDGSIAEVPVDERTT